MARGRRLSKSDCRDAPAMGGSATCVTVCMLFALPRASTSGPFCTGPERLRRLPAIANWPKLCGPPSSLLSASKSISLESKSRLKSRPSYFRSRARYCCSTSDSIGVNGGRHTERLDLQYVGLYSSTPRSCAMPSWRCAGDDAGAAGTRCAAPQLHCRPERGFLPSSASVRESARVHLPVRLCPSAPLPPPRVPTTCAPSRRGS